MEEKEEKKEKVNHGNTLGVVFVALLLVGLSVACGWFANSYFRELKDKPKESETKNEEKKDESRTVTEDEAFRLFNLFLSDTTCGNLCILDLQTVENFGNKSLITMKDLDNDTKFNILLRALKKGDIKELNSNGGSSNLGQSEISVDVLKRYSSLYFNEEISMPSQFTYYASFCKLNNDKYICDLIATGGEATPGYIFIPASYNVVDNKLQIDGFQVYDSVDAYYEAKGSSKQYCENVAYENVVTCLRQNSQYFKKVSMKFDLSNDKYLFVSVEK